MHSAQCDDSRDFIAHINLLMTGIAEVLRFASLSLGSHWNRSE